MLNETIQDERAWTTKAPQLQRDRWVQTLSGACLDLLADIVAQWKRSERPIEEIRLDAATRNRGRQEMDSVVRELDSGLGFVVLDRVDLDRYDREEATLLYWLLGQMIGRPFEQNIKGTLLYDVKDAGGDYTQGARFSVTSAESSFHTDGAFNPRMADYVGLLCLTTAKSGGTSQLVSGYSVHNRIVSEHRGSLETLYGSFHFDRRGEFLEGESATGEHPIFSWNGNELTVRFLKYYIDVGHEKVGFPLTALQTEAIDIMEVLVRRAEQQFEFSLTPGQMLWVNNHWILHNRTAFEDHQDPAKRRHFVRLWLLRDELAS
jgi:alpha-ketoglutarate-dependent taurine dioxygenase